MLQKSSQDGLRLLKFGLAGVTLDDVRAVDRGREPPDAGLMCDLLWSDPQAADGRSPSKRGVGSSRRAGIYPDRSSLRLRIFAKICR